MEKFKVDFYKEEDGSKPVGQFIRSLDIKMKAKVVANMHLLEEYGNMAREPLSKDLGGGIFELRIIESSDIVRVLYDIGVKSQFCERHILYVVIISLKIVHI